MRTAKEILCEVFEAYGDDLQLNITLNPSVSLIEQAMEAYHEDKTRLEIKLPTFSHIYNNARGMSYESFEEWMKSVTTPPKINAE